MHISTFLKHTGRSTKTRPVITGKLQSGEFPVISFRLLQFHFDFSHGAEQVHRAEIHALIGNKTRCAILHTVKRNKV